MDPADREEYEALEQKFKEVLQKYEEYKDPSQQHLFVLYIWEEFVPDEKKKPEKPLTDADRSKDMKFARWIVARVSNHVHPDKYINYPIKKAFM